MRPPFSLALRGVLKFLAVVAAAGAVGVGVGVGLSKLNGDSSPGSDGLPAVASATSTTPTAQAATTATTPRASTSTSASRTTSTNSATTATTAAGTPLLQGAAVPSVRVVSATLFPAATAQGRASGRARVSIRVMVTNRDRNTLTPPNPLLLTGSDRIGVDQAAGKLADPLVQPLAPSKSATGELRFEIAGAVTKRLTAKPRARLAIVNRIVVLKITISPTPAQPG